VPKKTDATEGISKRRESQLRLAGKKRRNAERQVGAQLLREKPTETPKTARRKNRKKEKMK